MNTWVRCHCKLKKKKCSGLLTTDSRVFTIHFKRSKVSAKIEPLVQLYASTFHDRHGFTRHFTFEVLRITSILVTNLLWFFSLPLSWVLWDFVSQHLPSGDSKTYSHRFLMVSSQVKFTKHIWGRWYWFRGPFD